MRLQVVVHFFALVDRSISKLYVLLLVTMLLAVGAQSWSRWQVLGARLLGDNSAVLVRDICSVSILCDTCTFAIHVNNFHRTWNLLQRDLTIQSQVLLSLSIIVGARSLTQVARGGHHFVSAALGNYRSHVAVVVCVWLVTHPLGSVLACLVQALHRNALHGLLLWILQLLNLLVLNNSTIVRCLRLHDDSIVGDRVGLAQVDSLVGECYRIDQVLVTLRVLA